MDATAANVVLAATTDINATSEAIDRILNRIMSSLVVFTSYGQKTPSSWLGYGRIFRKARALALFEVSTPSYARGNTEEVVMRKLCLGSRTRLVSLALGVLVLVMLLAVCGGKY